jgi:hypothetical protein
LSPVVAKVPAAAAGLAASGVKAPSLSKPSTAGLKPQPFKAAVVQRPKARVATKPAAVKVAAKSAGKAKPKADGRSAANERLFAELAAARKQSVAAQAKKPAAKAVQR